MVDVWLAYQGINTMEETQDDFHDYLAEEMIDNTYDSFMMRRAKGKRGPIVESDDKIVDDNNPLFFWINGAPRYGISLHLTLTKNTMKRSAGTEIK